MSQDSLRWPGTEGSPGLDFSPHSKDADGATAEEVETSETDVVDEPESQPEADSAAEASDADGGWKSGSDEVDKPADSSWDSPTDPPVDEDPEATNVVRAVSPDTPVAAPSPSAVEDTMVRAERLDPVSAASATAFTRRDADSLDFRTPSVADEAVESLEAPPVPARAADPVGAGLAGAAAGGAAAGGVVEADLAPPARKKREPRVRRTRKARLRLARIDPWSVMKTTFLFAIGFGVMTVVVVSVLWTVLAGSGALDSLDSLLGTLFGDAENNNPFRLEDYLNTERVLGFTALVAAIDVVIITAVATLFSFLYNLAATILGGLEVTLAED